MGALTARTVLCAWLTAAGVLLPASGAAAQDALSGGPAAAPAGLLAEYLAEGGLPDKLVYVVRPLYRGGHAYETFGTCYAEGPFDGELSCRINGLVSGGQLRVRELRTGRERVLLSDAAGSVRDPYVHSDGRRIVLSYRPGGEEHYHLYEVAADGASLRQITHGPYDDIDPCYLPDGGILFVSSRARRFVPCFVTPVGLIYRCSADGGDMRLLTCNVDHDLRPWVLNDGRIAFTRWEYVDRHEEGKWDLWAMRPDGSGLARLFGQWLVNPKPIPGSGKIVAVSGNKGATNRCGPIVRLEVDLGSDTGDRVSDWPKSAGQEVLLTADKSKSGRLRDPMPLSPRWMVLASDAGIELARLSDAAGRGAALELLIANPDGTPALAGAQRNSRAGGLFCHSPVPLAAQDPKPVLAPVTDWTRTTGRLVVADAHHGRAASLDGIRRGEIKAIAVYEQLPVPVKFRDNTSGQVSLGSTWQLKRYLGTFPVEADGSAAVEVPARRDLQLVALDGNGLGIKRMHAAFSVMPGETLGCVGCHEPRHEAPGVYAPRQALRRPVSDLKIEPLVPADGVVDYVRTIQPLWDRHCMPCHGAEQWAGKLSLAADRGPLYMQSAFLLVWRGLVSLPAIRGTENPAPRRLGSPASPLLAKLRGGHQNARLSDQEYRLVQIWIDGGGLYASHYACNDTGSGPVDLRVLAPLLKKHCQSCHNSSTAYLARFGPNGPHGNRRERFGDWSSVVVDITRPDRSLMLRAPLAKEAGGLGWCTTAGGKPVFATGDDGRYRELAALLPKPDADGRVRFNSFELPGFRPIGAYLRVMQVYGALPADFNPRREMLDLQALEETYQQMFHPGADDSGMKHLPAGPKTAVR